MRKLLYCHLVRQCAKITSVMNAKVEKLPKSQLKLTVVVEKEKVKEAYNAALAKAVEVTTIDGFRKGNAPKEMVEQKIGVSKLYGDVVDDLLQKYYPQVLKENHIQPVSNPKVEIKEFDTEKDFEFIATVATKPEIKIGNYTDPLKKYYADKIEKTKKDNEEKLKKGEKLEDAHVHLHPSEIIEELVKATQIEIPELLVEEETNRMLSRLVEQINATGMKVEDYLKAQQTDIEKLKASYDKISEKNIKAEFILAELVLKQNLQVEDKDIDEVLAASGAQPDSEEVNNPYQRVYIKSILEKNKLITNLIKEIEGENHHEHK